MRLGWALVYSRPLPLPPRRSSLSDARHADEPRADILAAHRHVAVRRAHGRLEGRHSHAAMHDEEDERPLRILVQREHDVHVQVLEAMNPGLRRRPWPVAAVVVEEESGLRRRRVAIELDVVGVGVVWQSEALRRRRPRQAGCGGYTSALYLLCSFS